MTNPRRTYLRSGGVDETAALADPVSRPLAVLPPAPLRDGQRQDETQHAQGRHRADLEGEAVVAAQVAAVAALLAGDDQEAAEDSGDEAADVGADRDRAVGEGEDEVEDDQEAELAGNRSRFRPRATTKVAPRMPKIAPEAPALTVSGLNQRAQNEPATRQTK